MTSRIAVLFWFATAALSALLTVPALANDNASRANTEDWTLTLVIHRSGTLEERLSSFPTRRACYDAMFLRIKEAKRVRGQSAAGICMKLFVGPHVPATDADRLLPQGPRVAHSPDSDQ